MQLSSAACISWPVGLSVSTLSYFWNNLVEYNIVLADMNNVWAFKLRVLKAGLLEQNLPTKRVYSHFVKLPNKIHGYYCELLYKRRKAPYGNSENI